MGEAKDFWSIVSHPSTTDEYVVGRTVLIEDDKAKTKRYVVITKHTVDEETGNHSVTFRDAIPGLDVLSSELVILVEE